MQRLLVAIACIFAVLASVRTSASATGQAGAADIRVTYGTVCDPTCGYLLGALVENLGPDDATGIVVTFAIPNDAPIVDLSIDSPCRITSPGNWHAGQVRVEIDSIPVGSGADIEIRCSLPVEEGWYSDVTFVATTTSSDPDPSNNTLQLQLSVPFNPVVAQIRELSDPFRLEITGERLSVRPFGLVLIGSCSEVMPQSIEEVPDGTKLVLLGGRQLRRLFPKGQAVRIHIVNSGGGELYTSYTRR